MKNGGKLYPPEVLDDCELWNYIQYIQITRSQNFY
ncbi:hypothetical protein ACJIZ3_014454 [Penstemon smallii]|uniref:Uncharacterized protein n=1 Tax=Penstemon smallii TaxID=265156 RepID=A0ABD3RMV6_9LAMI